MPQKKSTVLIPLEAKDCAELGDTIAQRVERLVSLGKEAMVYKEALKNEPIPEDARKTGDRYVSGYKAAVEEMIRILEVESETHKTTVDLCGGSRAADSMRVGILRLAWNFYRLKYSKGVSVSSRYGSGIELAGFNSAVEWWVNGGREEFRRQMEEAEGFSESFKNLI